MDQGQHLLEKGVQQLRVAPGEARHLHLIKGRQERAPEGLGRPVCCRAGQQSFRELALQGS